MNCILFGDIWLPSIAMEGLKGNDVHGFLGFFTRLYGLEAFQEGLAAPSLNIMQGMGVAAPRIYLEYPERTMVLMNPPPPPQWRRASYTKP